MSTPEPTTPAPAPLIFAAMVKAMGNIGHIGKDRKNTQQNYSFRGIDDLYNAVHPALIDAQIFICPSVTNREHQERQSNSGGVLFYETLTVEHKFYAIDGSFVTVTTMGSAMDSGDKAVNKAMSAAMKYALLEAFCIPTEGDNDTENHSPDVAPRRQSDREVRDEFEAKAGARRPTTATVVKQPAVATQPASPTASSTATTGLTATSQAKNDGPSKEEVDQIFYDLVGDKGILHQDYKVLVNALYRSSPTMQDRAANLGCLLKSVQAIHKAIGPTQGTDMISDLTLGLSIDRKNPTAEDAGEWLMCLSHCSETGEILKGSNK